MAGKDPKEAMNELTLMLMYLSRFKNNDRWSKDSDDFYAWKGYDFDVLNHLDDEDYIYQGNHPSRSKSVYITEEGKSLARKLLEEYSIDDWDK